jgi:hypothetical protein
MLIYIQDYSKYFIHNLISNIISLIYIVIYIIKALSYIISSIDFLLNNFFWGGSENTRKTN